MHRRNIVTRTDAAAADGFAPMAPMPVASSDSWRSQERTDSTASRLTSSSRHTSSIALPNLGRTESFTTSDRADEAPATQDMMFKFARNRHKSSAVILIVLAALMFAALGSIYNGHRVQKKRRHGQPQHHHHHQQRHLSSAVRQRKDEQVDLRRLRAIRPLLALPAGGYDPCHGNGGDRVHPRLCLADESLHPTSSTPNTSRHQRHQTDGGGGALGGSAVSNHRRGNRSLAAAIVPSQAWQSIEYECIRPYELALPIFLEDYLNDRSEWLRLERPYDGCAVHGDLGTRCHFRGGCSHYQLLQRSRLRNTTMGECKNHPFLEAQRVDSDLEVCDKRILVPLDVPEGLYFGQLHNSLQRLLRVWFRERSYLTAGDHHAVKFLLYTNDRRHSVDTDEILQRMGVEVTTTFPQQCFERILWGCHIVNFDPTTPKLMSDTLRRLFRQGPNAQSGEITVEDRINPEDDQQAQEEDAPSNLPESVRRRAKELHRWARQMEAPVNRRDIRNCTHVYATRLNSHVMNGRRMSNEAALVTHLRSKHDFCILEGDQPLQTWVAALRHTKVFMGPHGAALMHMYWLDPKNDPVVIELDGYNKYTIFWLHAMTAGYRYAWLSFESRNGIDLSRVDALLQRIEAPQA